jgi:hypothetical protein
MLRVDWWLPEVGLDKWWSKDIKFQLDKRKKSTDLFCIMAIVVSNNVCVTENCCDWAYRSEVEHKFNMPKALSSILSAH